MRFYFRHTDITDHPQVLEATFWGAQVFTAVCDVNAAKDFGGEVPKAYVTPAWLARTMNLQPSDVPGGDVLATVREGLKRCFVTGLLIETESSVVIDGWARRQPKAPSTVAERVRKHRESKKMKRSGVTVTDVTRVTTVEESRVEESKEKPLRAAPAAAESVQPPPQKPAVQEQPPSGVSGQIGRVAGSNAGPDAGAHGLPGRLPGSMPGRFELTSPAAEKQPPKPSEWEELRDRLDDARVRARPEVPDDPGFCATRKECNTLLSGAAKWLESEDLASDREEAKELLRKAVWLYVCDDWPGKQLGMTPWSLSVLLKRKHLGAYVARARDATWKHDELENLFHPTTWSP